MPFSTEGDESVLLQALRHSSVRARRTSKESDGETKSNGSTPGSGAPSTTVTAETLALAYLQLLHKAKVTTTTGGITQHQRQHVNGQPLGGSLFLMNASSQQPGGAMPDNFSPERSANNQQQQEIVLVKQEEQEDDQAAHLAKFSYLALLQGDFADFISMRAAEAKRKRGSKLRRLVTKYRRLVMRRRVIEDIKSSRHYLGWREDSWGGGSVAFLRGFRWCIMAVLIALCINLDLQRVVPSVVRESERHWEAGGGAPWPPVVEDCARLVKSSTATRPPSPVTSLPTAVQQHAEGIRTLEEAIISAAQSAPPPSPSTEQSSPSSSPSSSSLPAAAGTTRGTVSITAAEEDQKEVPPDLNIMETPRSSPSSSFSSSKGSSSSSTTTTTTATSSTKATAPRVEVVLPVTAGPHTFEKAIDDREAASVDGSQGRQQTSRQLAQGAAMTRLFGLPRLLRKWCFFPAVHLQAFNNHLSLSSLPWRRRRATEEAVAAALAGSELVTTASARQLQLSTGMAAEKLERLYQRAFIEEDMTLAEILAACGLDQFRRSMELRWLRLQEWLTAVLEDWEQEEQQRQRLQRNAIGCRMNPSYSTQEQVMCWLRNLWGLFVRHGKRVVIKSRALQIASFTGQSHHHHNHNNRSLSSSPPPMGTR